MRTAASSTSDAETIVWGTDDTETIVWGTEGADTIVWGTDDADTIVWGTTDADTMVWGTQDQETIVWGTDGDGDSIVWGTNCLSDPASPSFGVAREVRDFEPGAERHRREPSRGQHRLTAAVRESSPLISHGGRCPASHGST